MSERLFGAGLDRREVGDIDGEPLHARGLVQAGHGLVQKLGVAIPDRDLAAGRKDAGRNRQADALRTAGDDRDAVFQIIDIHRDSPLPGERRMPWQPFWARSLKAGARNRMPASLKFAGERPTAPTGTLRNTDRCSAARHSRRITTP